jgi:hypothetical protein
VETAEAFVPLLKAAFPDLKTWQRVVFAQQDFPRLVAAGDYSFVVWPHPTPIFYRVLILSQPD